MPIAIVTDSNCDLPQEIIQHHGIAVVPLYINIGTKSYLDGSGSVTGRLLRRPAQF